MSYDFDQKMMLLALEQAHQAQKIQEVPVGAVLIADDKTIIAAKGNRCIANQDPLGHAEIRVIQAAGKKLQNYRLLNTTLYVTLEPCPMCSGALIQARIKRVVFGASDPKTGGLVSKYQLGSDGLLNHTLQVTGGILAKESALLLKNFFKKRR